MGSKSQYQEPIQFSSQKNPATCLILPNHKKILPDNSWNLNQTIKRETHHQYLTGTIKYKDFLSHAAPW